MDPADFTPRWLAGLDGSLSVSCSTCRVIRVLPLRKLIEGGRDKQPIRAMVFRCKTCGEIGAKSVDWRDSRGDWIHDYETGETRAREKLPGIYPPPDQR